MLWTNMDLPNGDWIEGMDKHYRILDLELTWNRYAAREPRNIPSAEFMKRYTARLEVDLYDVFGIGQGEIKMSTLQIANLAAIIAIKVYYVPT